MQGWCELTCDRCSEPVAVDDGVVFDDNDNNNDEDENQEDIGDVTDPDPFGDDQTVDVTGPDDGQQVRTVEERLTALEEKMEAIVTRLDALTNQLV